MSFKIITSDEVLPQRNLVVTIFAQPGTGKTSLSFTSDNPFLMDFDDGVQRCVGRKGTAKFDTWSDAIDFVNSGYIQEKGIKTLICDTGGVMLDEFIGPHVIKENPKNSKKGGGLALQGYGAIKEVFGLFLNQLRTFGVDLIIICHAQEKDDDGSVRIRPKMTGGSYDILISKSDLVGYMEMLGGEITLDFNPTDRHIGKNCSEFQPFKVPHYAKPEYADYFGKIIQRTKDKMAAMTEEQEEAQKKVQGVIESINGIEKLVDLVLLKSETIDGNSQLFYQQMMKFYDEKYIELWKAENVDTAKSDEDFNTLIDASGGLEGRYKKEIKNYILEFAIKSGFVLNKEKMIFEIDPEFKKPKEEAQKKEGSKNSKSSKEGSK